MLFAKLPQKFLWKLCVRRSVHTHTLQNASTKHSTDSCSRLANLQQSHRNTLLDTILREFYTQLRLLPEEQWAAAVMHTVAASL